AVARTACTGCASRPRPRAAARRRSSTTCAARTRTPRRGRSRRGASCSRALRGAPYTARARVGRALRSRLAGRPCEGGRLLSAGLRRPALLLLALPRVLLLRVDPRDRLRDRALGRLARAIAVRLEREHDQPRGPADAAHGL